MAEPETRRSASSRSAGWARSARTCTSSSTATTSSSSTAASCSRTRRCSASTSSSPTSPTSRRAAPRSRRSSSPTPTRTTSAPCRTCCPSSRACRSTPRTLARGLLGNKIKEHKLHNNPLIAARAGRRDRDRAVPRHPVPGRPLDPGRDGHRAAHPGRHDRPHRRLQVRPHAGRRQAVRLPRSSPGSARRACICLLSDSTRAENPGYTPSERTVGEAFREIMEPLDGRVIVATFASNIARVQQVLDAAADLGRKVTVIGRSMEQNFRIATDLGYLKYDPSHDRAQGQDQGPSRTTSSSSPRPAPRASRWRASRGWPTATTGSSRSSPATPSS